MNQMLPVAILVTLSIGLVSSGVPHFIRGRPKGGMLGNPAVELPPSSLPQPNFFDQRLNHFNDADLRTWKQRFFVNDTYFKDRSGPVFFMIGGEGEANAIWLLVGSMMSYAKKYGALCLMLEHRYYGESHPVSDMSNENMQYLSSEQALADLAAFREAMVQKFKLTALNKWISFGGSYPGALSGWFRLKYPHLVSGAVASSAPVHAQLNFQEYLDTVAAALQTTGPTCVENVRTAVKTFENMVSTSQGLSKLSAMFSLCSPLKLEDKFDIINFESTLAGNFMNVVQYNKDNRKFEGAVGTNITVDTLCHIMNSASAGDPLTRYSVVNKLILDTYGEKCLDVNYLDFVKSMKDVSWSSSAAEGGRQWMYQTCTEFGYYQSSDSSLQPFGHLFPLSFSIKQCMDIFGPQFNSSNIQTGIDRTNTNYGGYGLSSSKIVFPNGSIDPWHVLSFTEDISSSVTAIFIHGTAHCANMYPATANDPVQLVMARQKIETIIGNWLSS